MAEATVTIMKLLNMQVCVPRGWDNNKILEFAEQHNPCGTSSGWHITKEGHEWLGGSQERVQCEKEPDNVHIMINA